eukprot:TRINITY_DN16723_c0_g7_i6.p1 TRINITY_DN16723_c0_g7~~TRINITY_DN16723_c0_g7_i6.p1  ORF type:complete len:225 (+),score=48.96 TRINITY_DN16723_c0_g7_i6:73-747(+)
MCIRDRYSFPNIVIAFFAGYLADKFGRKISIVTCGALVLIGEVLFVSGMLERSFTLAAIGRFTLGIGAEPHSGNFTISSVVITLESLSYWNYRFLPISLALNIAAKKLSAGINSLLTPYIYSKTGNVSTVFYIALGTSVTCLGSALLFAVLEHFLTKESAASGAKEQVSISGVLKFPKVFWLLIFYMGFFDAIINSLYAITSGMAQKRFGFDVTMAGTLLVAFV